MGEEINRNDYILPNDQPLVELECSSAFKNLTKKEKLYAHYLSRASWNGHLITAVQISPESPLIFAFLHKMFLTYSVSQLKDLALKVGFTEDDFAALLVYACGIFSNAGNYKNFGNSKFIPHLDVEKLEALVKEGKFCTSDLWMKIKKPMYSLSKKEAHLGFPDAGVTTYFSSNCTIEDTEIVGKWLKAKNLDCFNQRMFKTVKEGFNEYEIRLASVETGPCPGITIEEEIFEGNKFKITRGDYSELLSLVCDDLRKAQQYAANDNERSMIECYIKSFTTGNINEHKNGSRYWIKDKGPVIETYIGFIETYRDPSGIRGEFEGFVAMVNKEMSKKFSDLVNNAETFLKYLPWSREFEKDKFLQPDFTSLDILTFSGSIVPIGINIPNYDDIRYKEGFKNVSLGNVIPASYKQTKMSFLSAEDESLIAKYRIQSYEVQVGLHELLGHGSGNLFKKNSDGSLNFNPNTINPLTNQPVDMWYDFGENYEGKFTTISSSYEECKAEAVGLYLSLNMDILKIFGYEGKEAEDVIYVNWLSLIWGAIGKCLEVYQPSTKQWLQAHQQARFVLMRVLVEAGEGLLQIEETIPGEDLLIRFDRTKIQTVGKKAIGDFLLKLQIYKSMGDVEKARKMYEIYSEVSNDGPYPWARWRDIVIAHKQPRRILIQANTTLDNDDNVTLKTYDSTSTGMIQSIIDRFPSLDIDTMLENIWEKDKIHFHY